MHKDEVKGAGKQAKGAVKDAVGGLTGNEKLQAEGKLDKVAGKVQQKVGEAKDAARDATDAAVNYAKDAYENSGDTVRSGQQAVAKTVQQNPLGALLVAAGIGFALALLMTRPPRRPPSRWRYYG